MFEKAYELELKSQRDTLPLIDRQAYHQKHYQSSTTPYLLFESLVIVLTFLGIAEYRIVSVFFLVKQDKKQQMKRQ